MKEGKAGAGAWPAVCARSSAKSAVAISGRAPRVGCQRAREVPGLDGSGNPAAPTSYALRMTSVPMKGRSTSGTTTEPSACW
jgi:hypothetical protein